SLFNASSAVVIYTLSLHDALPIFGVRNVDVGFDLLERDLGPHVRIAFGPCLDREGHVYAIHQLVRAELGHALAYGAADELLRLQDRKSTRLNSSHEWISYAVFCLK